MRKFLFIVFLLLVGCDSNSEIFLSKSLPDCNSEKVKKGIVEIMQDQNRVYFNNPWSIGVDFEVINTLSKNDLSNICSGQVKLVLPETYGISKDLRNLLIQKIHYSVRKNEVIKNSFSISLDTNFEEISKMNKEAYIETIFNKFKLDGLNFLRPLVLYNSDPNMVDVKNTLKELGFVEVDSSSSIERHPGDQIYTGDFYRFQKDGRELTLDVGTSTKINQFSFTYMNLKITSDMRWNKSVSPDTY